MVSDKAINRSNTKESETGAKLMESNYSDYTLEDDEFETYKSTYYSYMKYEEYFNTLISKRLKSIKVLSNSHQNFYRPLLVEKIKKIKDALRENQFFLSYSLKISKNMFQNEINPGDFEAGRTNINCHHVDTILRQVYREWSAEGKKERDECFLPIIDEFCKIYSKEQREDLKLLIPGCGLGRLVYELATLGCDCIGNENSLFMLIISYGFLNSSYNPQSFSIYPWINKDCNNYDTSSSVTPFLVPDIKISSNVKMATFAGDFLDVFKDPSQHQFDSIITCFFIDTSNNIFEVVERIHQLLKPGGTWFNLGPLTYHYADSKTILSVEPSFADLKSFILEHLKFTLIGEINNINVHYFYNPSFMDGYFYNCPFFVVRK